MASSDGLDEDCMLQRGRSQSDPSSITEVRLGEAHRAGKRRRGEGGPYRMLDICHLLITLRFWQVAAYETHRSVGARLQPVTPITSAVIPMNLYAINVGCVVNVRHLLSPVCAHCCAVLCSRPYVFNNSVTYNDKTNQGNIGSCNKM